MNKFHTTFIHMSVLWNYMMFAFWCSANNVVTVFSASVHSEYVWNKNTDVLSIAMSYLGINHCEMLKTLHIQIYCVVNCLSVHTPLWCNMSWLHENTGYWVYDMCEFKKSLTFYQVLKVLMICQFWFPIPLFWLVCVVDISVSSKPVRFARHV
jgi:hypothetical protein